MQMKHALVATTAALLLSVAGVAQAQQSAPPSSDPGKAPAQSQSTPPAELGAAAGAGKLDRGTLHEVKDNQDQIMIQSLGVNAKDLSGMDIYGSDGKKIGDVGKVLADKSQQVKAVTVDVGGFLGIGAREVILPIDKLQKGQEKDRLQVSLSKAELEALDEWEARRGRDPATGRSSSPDPTPGAPPARTEPSAPPSR